MRHIIVAAATCLALAGCSNLYIYVKDGADAETTQAAITRCKSAMAPLTGDEAKEAFDKCMADKGYEKKVEKYRM